MTPKSTLSRQAGGLLAALVATVLVVEPLAAQGRRPPPSPPRAAPPPQTLDEVVATALRSSMTPGGVVAIVRHDSLVFLKAYGRTGADSAAPLAPDALFQVGPVAELVNALAAARLAREGKLSLDAPVGRLVPELPELLGRATLAQLLTHTAGLAVRPAVPGRGGADNLGAAARQLTKLDRVADPGTMYSHSPTGVALSGLVLERALKQPYAKLLQATVLDPVGMTSSTFDFTAAAPQLTAGHLHSNTAAGPFEPLTPTREAALTMPVGGLYSTASDLARLAAALLNDGVVAGERVLPADVAAELLTDRAPLPAPAVPGVCARGHCDGLASENQVGFGTLLGSWEGRRSLRVAGGAGGYGVLLRLLPDERLGVIILTNKHGVVLSQVVDAIFRRTLDLPESPRVATEPAPVDSGVIAELAAHPGTYLNGSEMIEIVVQDGRPFMRSDELVLELRPLPGRAVGVMLDRQVVLAFRLLKDDSGRPYLWIDRRALGRRER